MLQKQNQKLKAKTKAKATKAKATKAKATKAKATKAKATKAKATKKSKEKISCQYCEKPYVFIDKHEKKCKKNPILLNQ